MGGRKFPVGRQSARQGYFDDCGSPHYFKYPLTLKQLNMLLDFSEAGIRKQLRNLISQGWIDLRPIKDDGRLKIVFATPRLIKTIQAFELEWEKLSESL